MLGVVVLWFLLDRYMPGEEEREASKLSELENRNVLEKQLVGKWNHSEFPAGLDNHQHYHLLGADGSYTYRGSNSSKRYGKKWTVSLSDSVLFIDRGPSESRVFKIKRIEPDNVFLQLIENDSLTTKIEWFRDTTFLKIQ